MAIVKMKRLRLIALEHDRAALLRRLQTLGCLQLSEPGDETDWKDVLRREETDVARRQGQLRLLENALATLRRIAPEHTGLLTPRPAVAQREFLDESSLAASLALAQEVTDHAAELSRLASQEQRLTGDLASLAPWRALDVPLGMPGTHRVDVTTGTVPGPVDFDAMRGALADAADAAELYCLEKSSEQQCLLLLSHKSCTDAALEALRDFGFTTGQLKGWHGTVQENEDRLCAQLDRVRQSKALEREMLTNLGARQAELRLAADRISTALDREVNGHRLLGDDKIVCLQGWVPAEDVPRLTELLEQFDCAWELADPTEEDIPQVPVKLKSNFFTRSMNCITEQYSLPAYDGVDPHPLMAPFFVLFFGMMMADMAYGLLMIIGAAVFLKKKRPADRSFMEMILWCGVSTFLFGALTGGFMGDFIPQLCRFIDPESTFEMPALFTPLNDTMAIMGGSLVLGVLQIFTGMTASIVKKTQEGRFADALWDEITWWIILAGIALMLLKIATPGGVPVVLIIGVLMLLYGSGRNARGFGKLIAFGGAVYNGTTGFFRDILSYVRLMALNLLGCYVHDMRLQFLEFFGRFYKEGGKPFTPLSLQAKHVEIIKEDK